MRLTELVESTADGRYRCDVCQWRCTLAPGEVGRCQVRAGDAAGIAVLNDGLISAATVGPIEDHRLWHMLPGTPVLSIGGWGYAFPADQQRGQYANIPDDENKRRRLAPDRAANFALEQLCRGVVWAYSDPSVSEEYVKELLQLCRASSRYTALVTSGYLTIAALDQLGHYLDAINLELRAFDDGAYTRLAGVEDWRGILDVATQARDRWGCHIEVTTRLHPNVNDSAEQVQALAGWVRDALGSNTPWHVLPGDAGAAAAATVARARRLAHEAGLHFVYGPEPGQNTNCPSCGALVIERGTNGVRVVGLDGGSCAECGTNLGIRTSIFKR
ncbi:MAG TPA: radical SAM protein [Roseiflexaceae bacterium]|jgi:pyruvate formate lyase activating enzyme